VIKSRTIMTHSAKVQPQMAADANPENVSWVDSTPAVVGNMVYAMSRDGALHALTTAGQLKWRLRTGGLDMSSPVVANGTVYVGSGYPNKDFWAVDAASGVVKWRTNSGLPDPKFKRDGQFVYSSQAFTDNTVYGAANDGGFYALDARTGALKWRYETQGGVYFHSPTVAGDIVVGAPGDYDTAVYGINRLTGELAWKYNSGLQHSYVSSPAYDGETVYIGIGEPSQQIVALDAKTGAEKWKYVTGYATQNSYTSSPAVTNNAVFVGTAQPKRSDPESGRLVALDKAKGSVLWEVKLPKPVLSSPSVAGNYVVVGCMDGTVRAYKWTP
jgi:outer membrane protein assembly factor BamB